jgi:hypothetical protein
VLLGPKKEQNFEPISRAYERAETVDVVGASCTSSIRTHPVVQKEERVSACGQTWWVLTLHTNSAEDENTVMSIRQKKKIQSKSGFRRLKFPI